MTFTRPKKQIKILNFNARSVRNKINELRCPVQTENIDATAVTETFIDTVNNDLIYEYNIDGYKFFNKDCINRQGGVAFYIAI